MRDLSKPSAVLLAVLLCACASSRTSVPEGLEKLSIRFADFQFQQNTVSRAQPVITVTPTLELTNPNDVSVTLVKIELELRGSPELVQLEQRIWPVDKPIAPGATLQHSISIFATLRSEGSSTVQLSPLYVSGRAFFDSPRGKFSQGFVQRQGREGETPDEEDAE